MDWEAFYGQFREPDFIAGYEIQNRLGGGAFGDVYKARKQSIGKAYAIKFLKLEDDAQRAVVERELSTVRHFAAIDHPNLVTIEDMGVVLGVPFLIMGYAGEDTLARRLSKGALDVSSAMPVFVQACRGVLALHDRRLVHFDLKPSNVFLKGDVARVGDYGLSKLLTDGRMTLSFGRGTPQYMAPEILRSRADHRADIYSLGVMLYEALVGELPFKPEGDGALILRETDDAPHFPETFPSHLRPVVERCLRLAPDDRYSDVGQLLSDLDVSARQGDSVALNWAPARRPSTQASRERIEGAAAVAQVAQDPSPSVGAATSPAPDPAQGAAAIPSFLGASSSSSGGVGSEGASPSAASGEAPAGASGFSGLVESFTSLARGAAAVLTGVWQGLRGLEPDEGEVLPDEPKGKGQAFGSKLRQDFSAAGGDLREASEELTQAAKGAAAQLRQAGQGIRIGKGAKSAAHDPEEDAGKGAPQDVDARPFQEANSGPDASAATPRGTAGPAEGEPGGARAKAQALVRNIAAAGSGRPAHAGPAAVPVPPKVEGGLVGTVGSTLVVGFEVLLALLSGFFRGLYLGARRLAERLLRRSGSALGRAARFGLFLTLMATFGFALTMLGMVFLEAFDLQP